MNDESKDAVIEPITASADGKRNAYMVSCRVVQAQMNYAACLNRQRQIAAGNAPRDWSACDTGLCRVRDMRREEELAGKAIFFLPRGSLATAAATAGRWVMDVAKKVLSPAPAPARKKSMFDAMGAAGSMADAVNAMPKTITVDKRPTVEGYARSRILRDTTEGVCPSLAPYAPMKVHAPANGESPLAMARRLAAAKKTSPETT